MHEFCKRNNIEIKSETVYDFTSADFYDYGNLIDKWNITSDLAASAGILFPGDCDDMLQLYKKILCACNLPALNESGKVYVPGFSAAEKERLESVLKNMETVLEQLF